MSVTTIESILRPDTIEDALAAVGASARPIAGGTDVMLHPPPGTTTLVDLAGAVSGEITASRDGFVVGAMSTLTAMLEHPGLAGHLGGVLPEMLVHVGSPLLRNLATIGGHLARGRLSDVVPTLLALDASIRWYDGTHREAAMGDYFAAKTHTQHMLITAVVIPHVPPPAAAAFIKFSRTFYDLALLNGACSLRLEGSKIAAARVAVGETPALGARVPAAETALEGEAPSPQAFAEAGRIARAEVETRADSRASAEYRSQLVGVAVPRCLAAAADRLETIR